MMLKSVTDDTRSAEKHVRNSSRSTGPQPMHFSVHKPGVHLESCCGICNLFPGVLLIAFFQVLVGSVLITVLLTHGKQYDEMHQSPYMGLTTGAILSAVAGAGLLLIIVALTENCKAMLVYLMVASMIWISLMSLAIFQIGRACARFKDAPKIKDEHHRIANLACVSGLFTFLGSDRYIIPDDIDEMSSKEERGWHYCVLYWADTMCGYVDNYASTLQMSSVIYFFSFVVVFSFYHFRYVRRAILLHEAECE